MPKLNPTDEKTLERFFHFLQSEITEGTAKDYRSHVRAAVIDGGFGTLDALEGNIDDAIALYAGTRYKCALVRYKDFLDVSASHLPEGEPDEPEVDLEGDLREYMRKLCRFAEEDVGGRIPNAEENWPPVKIKFESRKKRETPWLLEVLDFFERNLNRRFRGELRRLKDRIVRRLNADDSFSDDFELRSRIEKILFLIIGEHHASDDAICGEAQAYLDQLRGGKVRLLEVLLGEYIDHLFDKDGNAEEPRPSVIVLYLFNIHDFARENHLNDDDCQKATFTHEFFHFFHYYNARMELADAGVRKLPKCFLEYYPGTIVKESFADYFEHTVLLDENKPDHAKLLEASWRDNDVAYWPYSGAARIRDDSHFRELFHQSIYFLRTKPSDLVLTAERLMAWPI